MDRSFLIPIGISIFSISGILIALSIVYLDKPQTETPATTTLTPFKYIFLGTETLIPDPELQTTPTPTEEAFSEEVFPEETFTEEPANPTLIDTPQAGLPTFPAVLPSQASTSTSPGNTLQTTPTVTSTSTTASTATVTERYDNTDPLLDYDGDWVNQANVTNAYQSTLSVSNTIGNDLIFSFTGQQIIIGYLGQAGLGSLAISIDDSEFQLNQSAGKEWVSPQLPNDEHFVIIIHDSGTSVNLDYINILNSE